MQNGFVVDSFDILPSFFFRTTFFSTNKLFFVFICIFLVNVVSILDFVKYLPLTKEPKKKEIILRERLLIAQRGQ